MTGGEVIVEMLGRFGVEMMFGLPGDQTAIYDALYRHPSIRHVLVRHEQAAAHMADAYARSTGKVGVCDASIGPGATNLISGIAEAYTSGIPVIALVSAVRTDWEGRGCFQEIDQVRVFEPITKLSVSVDDISQIPHQLRLAFSLATSDRPGPVLLSFPIDVLKAEHEFAPSDLVPGDLAPSDLGPSGFDRPERAARFPSNRASETPTAVIESAVELLLEAEQPVILSGGGSVASGASAQVQTLAEMLGLPVATTYMGKGTIPENHPLCLGPYGLLGRQSANDYVLGADVALALGTRFTNVDTAAWRIPSPSTQIIQVDIDPTQLGRNYPIDLGISGDITTVVQSIVDVASTATVAGRDTKARNEVPAITAEWRASTGIDSTVAQHNDTSPVHPLQVIRALRNTMADDDVIICDSGFNQIWGGQYFEVRAPGRTYMGPRGFGVMGFSFPAAIGHALAHPDRQVVALCGDGGFAMVIQELETARRTGANVTVCIMNNSNLQYIKENQRALYDSRFLSTDFSELDYAAIAHSFGCTGIRVENSGDLEGALAEALSADGPAVVDVCIQPDVVPDRMVMQTLE